MSHLDTLDLKPDAPAEVRGEFNPIATDVTGIQISENLFSIYTFFTTIASSALQWVEENNEKPKESANAKCGWAVGVFWRNCKSLNRVDRPPYCHTGITHRWQHDALL